MYAQYSIELENLEKAYGAKVFKIKKKFKKSVSKHHNKRLFSKI